LYNRNLNKHIREERCEVLKLQKQQKENIFVNLVKEDELNKSTDNKLNKLNEISNMESESIQIITNNQKITLMKEMKIEFEKSLEECKKMIENELKYKFKKELYEHKKSTENKLKLELEKEFENKLKIKLEEEKNKIVSVKLLELEKNNIELSKQNYKLQSKMDKIVSKNKVKINKSISNSNNNNITTTNSNNTQNITNNVIMNNATIKLVDFGNEDLDKISYRVFIDTIRTPGASLCNKAIEGIHFNSDHPENHPQFIHILF
jgi:hypothetical protein